MKNIERAKNYQKKLYTALGREWDETKLRKYWEGGITGNEWDYLYDNGFLENDFCAWCGDDGLKSDYYRSPSFSMRQVRVPICDDCFIEATGGNTKSKASKSGCFIATATYGYSTHPDVMFLKQFRDEILTKTKVGKVFINVYYFISPYISIIISRSKYLRYLTRIYFISPIIKFIKNIFYNT